MGYLLIVTTKHLGPDKGDSSILCNTYAVNRRNGKVYGEKLNISVQRGRNKTARQLPWQRHAAANARAGSTGRDGAGTPRTRWFQLRTGLVLSVPASVAHGDTPGHPPHICAARHRPWRTARRGHARWDRCEQHKGPFSRALRSVTAWRVKEAEQNNAGRQRGQKISHHLCTNGFLPLC